MYEEKVERGDLCCEEDAQRSRPVVEELKKLDAVIDEIEASLEKLRSRLSPVLNVLPRSDGKESGEGRMGGSELCRAIGQKRSRLISILIEVRTTTDEVEV